MKSLTLPLLSSFFDKSPVLKFHKNYFQLFLRFASVVFENIFFGKTGFVRERLSITQKIIPASLLSLKTPKILFPLSVRSGIYKADSDANFSLLLGIACLLFYTPVVKSNTSFSFDYATKKYPFSNNRIASLTTVCDEVILNITVSPSYDILLSCDDSPVFIQATGSSSNGSYTISWVDQIGQSVLTIFEPGVYTAVITDLATGCTATASSFIELVDNIPLADAGSDATISCLNPCTTLNATIEGNSNVLTIEWTGPNDFSSNESEPIVCTAGEYILSVSEENGGCTIYDTLTISEIYQSVNSTHTIDICPNDCVNFAGMTFCESGNYQIDLFTWKNCDSIIFLTVNAVNLIANIAEPEPITCTSDIVNLIGQNSQIPSNGQFYWTTLDGNFHEIPSSLSPSVNAPGTYILHLMTPQNCSTTDTVVVIQDKTKPEINAGEDTQLDCPNQIATINGVLDTTLTDFQLSWSGPNNFSSPNLETEVDTVGVYALTVTNLKNGCFTEDDTYVGPPEVVSIDLTTKKTCWNEDKGQVNITLTNGGSAPYSYSLNGVNFQTDTSFQQLNAGTYTVYWKDAFQCGGETEIRIPEIPPLPNKLEDIYHICTDNYATINAAVNLNELQPHVKYKWSNGSTNPALLTNKAGEYWVDIIGQCETIHKDILVVNDFISAKEQVYVPSAFSPNDDLINDIFVPYIKHNLLYFKMRIYDRRGSLMFSSDDPNNGWDGKLKGREAHSGVYAWYIDYVISTCEGGKDRAFLKGDVTLIR